MTTIPKDSMGLTRVRPPAPATGNHSPVGSRGVLSEIVQNLRNGTRPSLVGQIPGLTPKMEQAFRSGRYLIDYAEVNSRPFYRLVTPIGGETSFGLSWVDLGLPEKTSVLEKAAAHSAYLDWLQLEVRFNEGNIATAQKAFKDKHRNIILSNYSSAGQIYHVKDILDLFPVRSLALDRIDLRGNRENSSRYGNYDPKTRKISIFNQYLNWDKYLFTVVLLHELGHAAFAALDPQKVRTIEALHKIFWQNRAVFATDFWGLPEGARISEQDNVIDFFAENLMHYVILGRDGMLGEGSQLPLRLKLYSFYLTQVFKP